MPTSAAGGGGSTAAIDSCAVLTDEEIEAATGQKVTERSISNLRPDVFPSICDIELDGDTVVAKLFGLVRRLGRRVLGLVSLPFRLVVLAVWSRSADRRPTFEDHLRR